MERAVSGDGRDVGSGYVALLADQRQPAVVDSLKKETADLSTTLRSGEKHIQEGSAVLRTFPGNVFLQKVQEARGFFFSRP